MMEKEMINPHDKIFINCDDIDAARLAVLLVGEGRYCIEDDDMPIFIFGGAQYWISEYYQMTFEDWYESSDKNKLIVALESMRLAGERSSVANPVGVAHAYADKLREKAGER